MKRKMMLKLCHKLAFSSYTMSLLLQGHHGYKSVWSFGLKEALSYIAQEMSGKVSLAIVNCFKACLINATFK